MGLVDFHTHFFSRPFFDTLAAAAPDGRHGTTPATKLAALAERTGIELPPDNVSQHWARWQAELDAHGVEHVVSFASLPPEVPALAEAAALAGGRMTPMALVDPTAKGAAQRTRELVAEGPFGGVLLFPAMHHFHPGGPEARGVLEVLNEVGGLCYVHCGMLVVKLRDLLGLPRPYDLTFANPLGVIPAANAFPLARFVIPHFGAGFFRETLMAGTQCENVHVDSSSTNSWIRTQSSALTLRDVFARALDVFGPERVLFGTDSGVFPAGWRAERLAEQTQILESLGLGADERGAVFGGNALRLLQDIRR